MVFRTNRGQDPYKADNIIDLIDEFRVHWNNNHTDIQRDTAHLFTGKSLIYAGVAYGSTICNPETSYSVSYLTWIGNVSGESSIVAHELGHSFGAPHCDCEGFTMVSYINYATQFSPETINIINSFAQSLNCLDTVEPTISLSASTEEFIIVTCPGS